MALVDSAVMVGISDHPFVDRIIGRSPGTICIHLGIIFLYTKASKTKTVWEISLGSHPLNHEPVVPLLGTFWLNKTRKNSFKLVPVYLRVKYNYDFFNNGLEKSLLHVLQLTVFEFFW